MFLIFNLSLHEFRGLRGLRLTIEHIPYAAVITWGLIFHILHAYLDEHNFYV